MRTRFVRVTIHQIASRAVEMSRKVVEECMPFRLPCEVAELAVLASIVAPQYGLRVNAFARCVDGRVLALRGLDVGYRAECSEATSYVIKLGFGIRGSSARKLDLVVKRCSAIDIERRGGSVVVLYSP